jgi:hypothetical protein
MKVILIFALLIVWSSIAKSQDHCFTKALQALCIKHFKKTGIVECIRSKSVAFNQEDLTFCLKDDDTICMPVEEACPR